MTTTIDHLIVAAPTLDEGAAHVAACLGIAPSGGGRHDRMGTHNRLLRLGPSAYLEVIAIDRDAPSPARPRWFGLDDRDPRAPPALIGWVVRTADVDALTASLPEDLATKLGPVTPMRRDDLAWSLTIPADGGLVDDGAMPGVIDWLASPHPITRLEDHGLVLESLVVTHPRADALREALHSIDFSGPVVVRDGDARLEALIRASDGVRRLT